MSAVDAVNFELEHLFRREASRLVAILTRAFGPSHLDLAETVVQEALVKAAQTWPTRGIPRNPSAWIMRVAKNFAIDAVRKDKGLCYDESILHSIPDDGNPEMNSAYKTEITDDRLRLMFICCHPVIPRESRVALTLKTVCGFGVKEIAHAYLAQEETIAQRLVRAKQKIKSEKLRFEFPEREELETCLDSVLETVYLLFNEGYNASQGDHLVREEICLEACRLGRLLAGHPMGTAPKVFALVALMLFQASRLKARTDEGGDLLLLREQNRSLWDEVLIEEALSFLAKAAAGDELSRYHLLAGITSRHAVAKSFEETDWQSILSYYDALLAMDSSPITALNRAVAVSFVYGPKHALSELREIQALPEMKRYYLFHATRADFHRRSGELDKAIRSYKDACSLTEIRAEQRFLSKRIEECAKSA